MSADPKTAVASLTLVGIERDGRRFDIHIGIGQPYEDPDKKAWRCPVALTGIDNRLPDLAGGDSFQALCIAVNFVRRRLRDTAERGVRLVLVENGEEFEFPLEAYFPAVSNRAT